jgi:hypothetical protein
MTRYYALVLAAIGCACGSLSETPPADAPSLSIVTVPQQQEANLPEKEGARSTVPMAADDQKDGMTEAVRRATHVFWFFGSR